MRDLRGHGDQQDVDPFRRAGLLSARSHHPEVGLRDLSQRLADDPGQPDTGDIIRRALPNRRLDTLVAEDELSARRAARQPLQPRYDLGWRWSHQRHVTQADQGCDFDFFQSDFGRAAGEPGIY